MVELDCPSIRGAVFIDRKQQQQQRRRRPWSEGRGEGKAVNEDQYCSSSTHLTTTSFPLSSSLIASPSTQSLTSSSFINVLPQAKHHHHHHYHQARLFLIRSYTSAFTIPIVVTFNPSPLHCHHHHHHHDNHHQQQPLHIIIISLHPYHHHYNH